MIWPTDDNGIVSLIISHEGGYIDNVNDLGGATNFGITIDTLGSWRHKPCAASDIKNLSVAEAEQIYATKYIVGPGFDNIADIKLRAAMVDFGVLFGPVRAIQSLQAVLKLPMDGNLGVQTLTTANHLACTRGTINLLSCARISFHAERVSKDHTQIIFLQGWLSRAMSYIE